LPTPPLINHGQTKILIVDNQKGVRKFIKLALSDGKYTFLESGDRDTALIQIQLHNPDLIILDIMLSSNCDDLELLQK
jgi:two-component system response regulator VicR